MIITVFPNTLGGVQLCKAGKLFRGGKPTQSPKAVGFPPLKPHLSSATA